MEAPFGKLQVITFGNGIDSGESSSHNKYTAHLPHSRSVFRCEGVPAIAPPQSPLPIPYCFFFGDSLDTPRNPKSQASSPSIDLYSSKSFSHQRPSGLECLKIKPNIPGHFAASRLNSYYSFLGG